MTTPASKQKAPKAQRASRRAPRGGSKPSPAPAAPAKSQMMSQVDRRQEQQIKSLQREVQKNVPSVKETFRTTVSLGEVRGSATSGVVRAATAYLNPALLRDKGGVTGPTPLTTKAGQFALFRIKSAKLKAYAMVGSSGVGGTLLIGTTALDAGQPSPTDFDSISARHNRKVGVGRDLDYPVDPKSYAGPKHTFYFINPADKQGNSALGPRLEVFVYGPTTNIYTNQPFEGVLWRLVLDITFEFANYTPNPAIVDMHIETDDKQVTVQSTPDGQVVLSTTGSLLTGRLADAGAGLGDVVFSLLDTGASVLSGVPVLGPLLQAGLAFLKPIFGSANSHMLNQIIGDDLTHHYLLCQNFDAAVANNPITVPVVVPPTQLSGEVVIQQLTPFEVHTALQDPIYPLPTVTRMREPPSDVFSWTFPNWVKDSVEYGTELAIHMKSGEVKTLTSTTSMWVLNLLTLGKPNGSAAMLAHEATAISSSVLGDGWSLVNSAPQPPRNWGGFKPATGTVPPIQVLAGREFLVARVHSNVWGVAPIGAVFGYMFIETHGRSVFAVIPYPTKPGDGRLHSWTLAQWI